MQTEGKERIVVVNKIDLESNPQIKGDIYLSAKTGLNIESLKQELSKKAFGGKIDLNADFLTEERHLFALKNAYKAISDAIDGFSVSTADLCAIDLNSAWQYLGEVSGETANERIIDEIFSKFCVGK